MQNYLSYINNHKSNFIGIMQRPVFNLPDSFIQYSSKVARKLLDEIINIDDINV